MVWYNFSIDAQQLDIESIPLAWLSCEEVYIAEGRFYIHTNLGSVPLTVLEYDEQGKRYLVECIKYEGCYYPQPEISLESQD